MSILNNYRNYTPCEFFRKPEVRRCLLQATGPAGLSQVFTQNSASVTWTGTGTQGDPLVATVISDAQNTPNLLIAGTDGTGTLIDATSQIITRTLTGFAITNAAIVASDTILAAFGKAQGQINVRAPLASPTFTGTPAAPTATPGTNTTQLATTAFVTAAVAAVPANPVGANPSVSAGLTANDGVATTFMRSDASPAISQAITPTWTGLHTFTANIAVTGASTFSAPLASLNSTGASEPILVFNALNGPNIDRKRWFISGVNGNFLNHGISNDAGTTTLIAYQMYRGLNTVGGHNWYIGTEQTNPKMSLSANGLNVGVTTGSAMLNVGDTNSALTTPANHPGITLTSGNPYGARFYMENPASTSGQRVFMLGNYGNVFSLNSLADAGTSFTTANIISATSAGAVSLASLGGTGTRNVVTSSTGQLQAGAAVPISGDSPTLTFDPVPANGFLDLGFTLTGAVIGESVALGIPAVAQVNGVIFTAMVSNTDVITIRCHNFTGSPISIPGGTYKATVFKS